MKKATKAAREAWPERCFSCGAAATGTFPDGSPLFSCHRADPERHVPRRPDGTPL